MIVAELLEPKVVVVPPGVETTEEALREDRVARVFGNAHLAGVPQGAHRYCECGVLLWNALTTGQEPKYPARIVCWSCGVDHSPRAHFWQRIWIMIIRPKLRRATVRFYQKLL